MSARGFARRLHAVLAGFLCIDCRVDNTDDLSLQQHQAKDSVGDLDPRYGQLDGRGVEPSGPNGVLQSEMNSGGGNSSGRDLGAEEAEPA